LDPARAIIESILRIVPASRWAFARIKSEKGIVSLLSSHANDEEEFGLAHELKEQRKSSPYGPRIAATLNVPDNCTSGITLVIAAERDDLGILTLLRNESLGSFTSEEVRMLMLALDTLFEHLSALKLRPASRQTRAAREYDDSEVVPRSAGGAAYVLNQDFAIVLTGGFERKYHASAATLQAHASERLPPILEETVRALTFDWFSEEAPQARMVRPVPFLVVAAKPMSGPAGLFIDVRVDRFQSRNSLNQAALQFGISPREIQTLALLLDGNQLEEIALDLHITSSTVQDHIKSMIGKTRSRNRSELIARIFGWYSPLDAHEIE
jgi:DNA-binding CsgD family transcriptional regulator